MTKEMSAKIKTIFKKTISKKNKRKNKRIIQCNNLHNNQCKTKKAKISSNISAKISAKISSAKNQRKNHILLCSFANNTLQKSALNAQLSGVGGHEYTGAFKNQDGAERFA